MDVLSRRIVMRRNGTVRQREHYLRDDIPCGHPLCLQCPVAGTVRPDAPGASFPSFRGADDDDDEQADVEMTDEGASDDDDSSTSSGGGSAASGPAARPTRAMRRSALAAGLPGPAPTLPPKARLVAVVDTNVALHQLDVLEMPQVTGVVVLQTVLEEVRHRSRACHERLVKLCRGEDVGAAWGAARMFFFFFFFFFLKNVFFWC
jgi:hypothetical protein